MFQCNVFHKVNSLKVIINLLSIWWKFFPWHSQTCLIKLIDDQFLIEIIKILLIVAINQELIVISQFNKSYNISIIINY